MKKNQNYFKNKRILVTGGGGFLGSHLIKSLKAFSPKELRAPSSKDLDLRIKENCAMAAKNIDIVIHLAAVVGGIGYNRQIPGTMFYDNILMGTYMMDEARKANVKKYVAMGTICAYPKFTPVPFKEKNLWMGYPEETNAPYGLAKKMQLVQAQAYKEQYNFNAIFLLPVNLYGPGDNFDPKTSHVIPSLIKKFVDAKQNEDKSVMVWGTGKATREFLYVEDAARAIILATEKYNKADPVNIGASFEISIKDLVEKIKNIVGYSGRIIWDKTKPDGQPRRKLDTSKAFREFGFQAKITFEKGLLETVNWYIKNKSQLDLKN